MMRLKPIKDKLLVKILTEKKTHNLIIPKEDKKGRILERGEIITMGNEVKEPIRSARIILFDHFAGTPVVLSGDKYVMMKSEDVQAVEQ